MLGMLLARSPSSPSNDPCSLVPPFPNVVGGSTNQTFPDWDNPNGRTPVAVSSLSGTTRSIVTIGQSLTTNCINGVYVPTNAGALNFSITNGALYKAKDPLMGAGALHAKIDG